MQENCLSALLFIFLLGKILARRQKTSAWIYPYSSKVCRSDKVRYNEIQERISKYWSHFQ